MIIEILAAIIATVLGGLFPLIRKFAKSRFDKLYAKGRYGKFHQSVAKLLDIEVGEEKSFDKRLEENFEKLQKAFERVEHATEDFNELLREKEASVLVMKEQVEVLSRKEENLKSKMESMGESPDETQKLFEESVAKMRKRNARRDYAIFVFAVIFSGLITYLVRHYVNV